MDITAPRTQAFFTLEEYSQIDLMSAVSGVKANLFHKFTWKRKSKKARERVILNDNPVLRELTSAREDHSLHPFSKSS